MMKRYVFLLFVFVTLCAWAQTEKKLPTLHVEGRWLVDTHGNQVVLHGVMDTPNMYFNGQRWGWYWTDGTSYDDNGAKKCLAYFEKIFAGLEKAKCDVFRLHLDPAWTNDPSSSYVWSGSQGQAADASGEADIRKFNPTRYQKFLSSLYLKLAEMAMNHGMYVVVRPPGVCPGSIKVGDYYNNYLLHVWDVFSQQDFVKNHAGQISIELANEPVSLKNANNQDDAKAMHDFFQPIVDKIRSNGFTGIIWAPGTTWQQNYRGYAQYPIEGDNIGYAVHDYCGWYGCSDDNPDPDNKIKNFHESVPVIDFAPVIITEVDWSPINPNGEGHYNESGTWVLPNYGTWATGSTSKWGKAYKAMLDYFGNISMTLSGTGCLLDEDKLLATGDVYPAFNGLAEACGKACMDWYAVYATVNNPRPDDEAETGDAYTIETMTTPQASFDLMTGDNVRVALHLLYRDGHTKEIAGFASYSIDNPAVVEVRDGYLHALAAGEANVTVKYVDSKETTWEQTIAVKVTGLGLSDFTPLSSLGEMTAQPFAILRKDNQCMFFGSTAQNLGFQDALAVINDKTINGYMFKAEPISGRDGCYLLRLMKLDGKEYSIWGSPGYLNGFSSVADCSFILGLNNQYGQDVKDGAVWEINYVDGKGFTLKNKYTGKYLKDATAAKYDDPVYMDFLKAGGTSGIGTVKAKAADEAVYSLHGVKVGTANQMDALPRGIYIIGGKKVVKSN